MYKQRFKQPNFNTTPTKNQAHVAYIGSRPGVMKHEGQESGLFGFVGGVFKRAIPLHEGIGYPKNISERGINMFRGTLSFTLAQAQGLGLNSLEEWQEYIKSQIWTIAKGNNIAIANLEWEAAVHQKGNHPHAHIVFWDKSQSIQVQFVKPQAVNKIRCELIKNTYPQLLQEYYDKKEISEKDMKYSFVEVINGYEDYLMELNISEYLDFEIASENKEYDASGLTKTDVQNSKNFAEICCSYIRIKNMLPEKGRIAYKLLPPILKSEINDFVLKVISSNEKLSKLVENYVSVRLDILEMYESSSEILEKKKQEYIDEAIKMLANSILGSIKDIDFYAGNLNSGYILTSNAVFGAFCSLAQITRNYESAYYSETNTNSDLSKQARKEKAIKNKDKGIGVEY